MELITFVFDEEYHPSILKKMSVNQRYALYCRANDCSARYEYQYIFDYPELERNHLANISAQPNSLMSKMRNTKTTNYGLFV